MRTLILSAAAVAALALTPMGASAAPLQAQSGIAADHGAETILIKHGHGRGHGWGRGGRGRHLGWYRGRGHHYGFYRGRHRGW